MESYRVIFTGNLTIEHQDTTLAEHLATLPFSEQEVEKLNSGKVIALKQNASLTDAIAFQNQFKRLGLLTHLSLKLSPDCFHAGLKNYSDHITAIQQEPVSSSADVQETTIQKNLDSPSHSKQKQAAASGIRLVDKQALNPLFAAQPKKYSIRDEKGQISHSLSLGVFKFGPLLLLPLCVLFALDIQIYILRLLTTIAGLHTAATILSLVFLLLMVACVPKIMQPLNRMTLRCTQTDKELVLADLQTAYLGKTLCDCEGRNGVKHGRISISQNAASFKSETDTFYWDAKLRLGDINAEALTNLQNAALDNTPLNTAMGAMYSFKKIYNYFRSKSDQNPTDWSQQPGSPIVNEKNQIIAIIHFGAEPAYRILDQDRDQDLCLSAFCISVLAKSLV